MGKKPTQLFIRLLATNMAVVHHEKNIFHNHGLGGIYGERSIYCRRIGRGQSHTTRAFGLLNVFNLYSNKFRSERAVHTTVTTQKKVMSRTIRCSMLTYAYMYIYIS
ncbi:hypothetical protein HRR83_002166 [Exophiala dermatitidis]|uniref:Uncharacterized protein n=1 Tax=Exophiala dermatitidis TaxID=5970 RepID=A0AAN6EXG6_EXODE|nr:hypothetical protein HRR74_002243 [Exophiala dermatitidis]KAJ4525680.1 hypothetical protein HRR73_002412 [Exophiala dermatitidis]KAJ4537004.1 hypothetical protein HRR76_005024 [Exophiala dermatitidis]KAJ4555397.1 hypothetical protein HRR77_001330 [Exophiala dermatitidis]KAJ4572288.1 hypothetical protein HRR79_003489 [Exophiala dermatitidis]